MCDRSYFDALTKADARVIVTEPWRRHSRDWAARFISCRMRHRLRHARNDPHVLYNYETLVDAVRTADDEYIQWMAQLALPTFLGRRIAGWQVSDGNPLAPVP